MVFFLYKKQRILYLSSPGHKPLMIARVLEKDGMVASRRGVAKFLKLYEKTGTALPL